MVLLCNNREILEKISKIDIKSCSKNMCLGFDISFIKTIIDMLTFHSCTIIISWSLCFDIKFIIIYYNSFIMEEKINEELAKEKIDLRNVIFNTESKNIKDAGIKYLCEGDTSKVREVDLG